MYWLVRVQNIICKGFRIDSEPELRQLCEEIERLKELFTDKPIFGVNFVNEDVVSRTLFFCQYWSLCKFLLTSLPRTTQSQTAPIIQSRAIDEDAEIMGAEDDALVAQHYYATEGIDDHVDHNTEITYDPNLGLAVEPPQAGHTLEQLWRVVAI